MWGADNAPVAKRRSFPLDLWLRLVNVKAMSAFHCPNCGAGIDPVISRIKMMTCPSCGTSLFLEDAGARLAGDAGVLHDLPMLFKLGDRVRVGKHVFDVLGQARFSYGRGTWDEFFSMDGRGNPIWISLDEGDVAIQRELSPKEWPRYDGRLRPGIEITFQGDTYRLSELEEAECIGLNGNFPEALTVGERHLFANLMAEDGGILSAEMDGDQHSWFLGQWYHPFDIAVVRT